MGYVLGVGINDIPRGKRIPEVYQRWTGMLQRCYDVRLHARQPTYTGCTVCCDWLTLSVFQKWLINNLNWKDRDIDKDLMVEGNKIYSPETCVLLPRYLNNIRANLNGEMSSTPLGVKINPHSNKNPFVSRCTTLGDGSGGLKRKYLGVFPTGMMAHQAWQKEKLNHIVTAIGLYEAEQSYEPRVVDRLKKLALILESDILRGAETKKL